MSIETTVSTLKIQVEELTTKLDNLVVTWNSTAASKRSLELLKTEILLLKEALERGDFTITSTVETDALQELEDKVTIAANAKSLLDSVQQQVEDLETRMDTIEAMLSSLSQQVGALVVKVDQHLITS